MLGRVVDECREGNAAYPFPLANPIPDGRSVGRVIELVDGALVDNREMVILYRERFERSFLEVPGGATDAAGFESYGFMVLQRAAADVAAADFDRPAHAMDARPSPNVLDVSCSAEILEAVLGPPPTGGHVVGAANATSVARAVVEGTRPSAPSPLPVAPPSYVHYLCHDTGLFDQGPRPAVAPASCPAGSGVTYFVVDRDQQQIADEPCNDDGTCEAVLAEWRSFGTHNYRQDPIWRCTDAMAVYCDSDRRDLRNAKTFFSSGPTEPVFVPLIAAVESAFRYRTRFRDRAGTGVGFVPAICDASSSIIPYCYDPAAIEEARARVDCALHVFDRHYASLDTATRSMLLGYLRRSFSYDIDPSTSTALPVSNEGFERLNAQLLIMLGDDAYTNAFASRFDLAGSSLVSFPGSRLEPPDGIDLSGGAGYEMYNLYQAVQYYQLVLDRFFRLSPATWNSISRGTGSAQNFVTQETVIAYFDRIVRASVQKSRAWSEVGKRYMAFNRPDLARRVVERAYSQAYLESMILSRMMLGVIAVADAAQRDQIQTFVIDAQRLYRVALLDMRELYVSFTDQVNYFGLPPDYIPFPGLDPGDTNAFTRLLGVARSRAATARAAEDSALAGDRSFDTDAAAFQAELVQIRNNYENQLAQVCGTFEGEDGRVYPAIPRYSNLSERTRILRDPCGLVGNGDFHDALAGVELGEIDARAVVEGYERVFAEVEIERDRVSEQCRMIVANADYTYRRRGEVNDLASDIRSSRNRIAGLDRVISRAGQMAQLRKCSVGLSTDCLNAVVAMGVYYGTAIAADVAITAMQSTIADREAEIADIERATARWTSLRSCDAAQVDSNARVRTLLLRLKELDVEALRQEYRVRLAMAQVTELRNQATRLLAEQSDAEQLAINVEAARNDPNVRIYRNDAIISADRTFHSAVREAYRATRIFEYYTSQSYPRLESLFLVRMIARGDYNLDRYLDELEDAYFAFRESFGIPDTRVAVLSLRDDILAIPRLGDDGHPMTQTERITAFRAELARPGNLDENGYLVFPFQSTLELLSPLTRNHKVLYVEAEIVGSDVGDTVGRVYIRQAGAGAIRSVTGTDLFYRFPELTAVVNPFFNGTRVFEPALYRNERLRDRPFVNSYWQLVLNQRDERVNQDVDLSSLTDVRLYVYYTDFTAL
jgi:hypothetical protein